MRKNRGSRGLRIPPSERKACEPHWADLSCSSALRVTSKGGWGGGAAGKDPDMQTLGPEFESPALIKTQMCLCLSSLEETASTGF